MRRIADGLALCSSQACAIAVNAAIHHRENAGITGACRRCRIDHAILQPKRPQLQSNAVVDDRGNVLGAAKHIDEINCGRADLRHCGVQASETVLAKNPVACGRNGNDAIAKLLQCTGDPVARPHGILGQSHDRDRLNFLQARFDLIEARVVEALGVHAQKFACNGHDLAMPFGCTRVATADIVYSICNDPSVPQDSMARHTVRLLPEGREISVAAHENLLAAALAAGVNLPHSCKSGHCTSCRARLVSGRTQYPRGEPLGLTAEEREQGYVLLCQAHALTDVAVEARRIRSVEQVEIKTLPARIARLERVGHDVMRVMLRLPAVEPLRFQPGQYLDVLLDSGRRRSFSIASPPHDSDLIELHVRLARGGGFTEWLFNEARVGALLKIEGPIGQFVYQETERPMLLIAGGTGFAPLKSIMRHVLERRLLSLPRAARKMRLFWGARRVEDLYERKTVAAWTAKHAEIEFVPVLSHELADSAAAASAERGLVHEAVLRAQLELAAHDIYAAGPPAMIEAIRSSFPAAGAAVEHLYFDSFDYAPDAAARG